VTGVIGSTEETTHRRHPSESHAKDGVLQFPVIAVNDSLTKHLFEQSLRARASPRWTESSGDQSPDRRSTIVVGVMAVRARIAMRRCARCRRERGGHRN